MILLDANAVIAVVNDRPRVIAERFGQKALAGDRLATSSIVLFELYFGIAKSHPARMRDNYTRLARFLKGPVDILAFDEHDAKCAGDIRASLAGLGSPIGPYDVLIAGQAMRHQATLITANTSEFSRVPGLKLDDWSN